MDTKLITQTPKDAITRALALRDDVRGGDLSKANLLRRTLVEVGLFKEAAFQRLLEQGRQAFLARNRAADANYLHDVESLAPVEMHNTDFQAKVAHYLEDVTAARSESETYARIDRLKAFLEEFGLMSREMLKGALGAALWEKYTNRDRSEARDESELEAQ
ncbi:MAG: hypothetical protein HUU15_19900 [Candidatus Brocadiae bacterium]|nr:hypothetical protein [Candidatus Brocadiia bacterium]